LFQLPFVARILQDAASIVLPRADGVGRVAYSEDRLVAQAEAIAKDASDYLARTGSSRTLHPNLNPRVARSTIIVNLYERAP